ncbi:hypothetical protein [Trebonia sp.]|uniref:hypothetical protein n=1 Tax=Trebonia sp. TaxID=2767075 RepID=UPI002638C5D1|nr:hypothetical protein [Trebonia sp.]
MLDGFPWSEPPLPVLPEGDGVGLVGVGEVGAGLVGAGEVGAGLVGAGEVGAGLVGDGEVPDGVGDGEVPDGLGDGDGVAVGDGDALGCPQSDEDEYGIVVTIVAGPPGP